MKKSSEFKTNTTKEAEKETTETPCSFIPSLDNAIASIAFKPEMNAEGVVILPAEWDDDEE